MTPQQYGILCKLYVPLYNSSIRFGQRDTAEATKLTATRSLGMTEEEFEMVASDVTSVRILEEGRLRGQSQSRHWTS